MDNAPKIYELEALVDMAVNGNTKRSIRTGPNTQKWVPARPMHLDTIPNRLKAAWLVFTGKADAVVWPGDQ